MSIKKIKIQLKILNAVGIPIPRKACCFMFFFLLSFSVFAGGPPDPDVIPPITNDISSLLLDKEFSATGGINDVVFDIQTGRIYKENRWKVLFNSPTNTDNEPFQELIELGVLSSYKDMLKYFRLLKEPIILAEHRQKNGLYYDEATGYLFEVKKGRVVKIFFSEEDDSSISFSYSRNDPFFVQKIYISDNPIKIDIVLSKEDSSITNINISYQYLAQDLKIFFCKIKIY